MEAYSEWGTSSVHSSLSPQPPFPWTVDERVQHGSEDGVRHKEILVQDGGLGRSRPHIYQHRWAIVKDDHSQMGGAGRQGHAPSFLGVYLQDLQEDEGVGGQDEDYGEKNHNNASHYQSFFIG